MFLEVLLEAVIAAVIALPSAAREALARTAARYILAAALGFRIGGPGGFRIHSVLGGVHTDDFHTLFRLAPCHTPQKAHSLRKSLKI